MLRKVSLNFAAQFLSLAFSFLDRFVVIGLLLRQWGTSAYADWAVLFSATNLISICELGLNVYFGNLLQKRHNEDDQAGFQRVVSTAMYSSGCLSGFLVLCVVFIMMTINLKSELSLNALSENNIKIIFFILAITTVSRVFRGSITQIYRGRTQFAVGTVIDLVSTASTTISSAAAVLLGASPAGVASVYFFCDLIFGWGVMLWDQRRRFRDIRHSPSRPTKREIGQMARHISMLSIQQGVPVAWMQLPIMYLSLLGTDSTLLVSFVISRIVVNLLKQLATMLSIAVGVEVAGHFETGSPRNVAGDIQNLGVFLSVLTASASAAIMYIGYYLIVIWTGRPEVFNSSVLVALLIGSLVAAPFAPLGQIMTLSHHPAPAAFAGMIQLIVGLSTCALLGKAFGLAGAAAGLAVGEVLANCVILPIASLNLVQFDYIRHASRCIFFIIAAGVWCALVAKLLLSVVTPASFVSLTLIGLAWTAGGLVPVMTGTFFIEKFRGTRHPHAG